MDSSGLLEFMRNASTESDGGYTQSIRQQESISGSEDEFDSGSESDETQEKQPGKDGNYIRPNIWDQVEEAASEYQRQARATRVAAMNKTLDPFTDRCAVCTLPMGTCKHNETWLTKKSLEASSMSATRLNDEVDMAMDDLTDVLSTDDPVSNLFRGTHDDSRISFQNLRWLRPVEHLPDKIGSTPVDISRPGALANHSMVLLGDRFSNHKLIIFGGIRTPQGNIFKPYSSVLRPTQTIEYQSEVYVFDLVTASWFHPDTNGDKPEGRMHHVAVQVDTESMMIFGGRGKRGKIFGDTYLFHLEGLKWEKVEPPAFDTERIYPLDPAKSPAPRFEAAATVHGGKAYVFGGRNIEHNFSDLWVYHISERLWKEPIVVGLPPSPRHGHSMVTLIDGRILVLGGCEAELSFAGLPADSEERALALRDKALQVSNTYMVEDAEVLVSATMMKGGSGELGMSVDMMGWREIARTTAELAAVVARRERDTSMIEAELKALLTSNLAAERWSKSKVVHKNKQLDVIVLDTANDRLTWSIPRFPAVSGKIPSCRMNFQACTLAGTKVLVLGGREPTANFGGISHKDFDLHMLDINSMRWSIPLVTNVSQGMQPSIDMAAATFRRAKRALQEAKNATFSQGVLGGNSVRIIEAEAVHLVAMWRLQTLIEEQSQVMSQPDPRYGLSLVNTGRRIFLFGGFDLDAMNDDFLVLDMEQPEEREARMEEEFHVYLEKERQKREEEARQAELQKEYEEKMRKMEEEKREAAERELMFLEDELSRKPPLTRAPMPRLKAANSHTLWLEWDPVILDAKEQPVDPSNITYMLYMKGGWLVLEESMKVLVAYHSDDALPKDGTTDSRLKQTLLGRSSIRSLVMSGGVDTLELSSAAMTYSVGSGRTSLRTPSGRRRLFKAVITRCHLDGTFDVKYADRSKERKVARERIFPRGENFQWEMIYHGNETSYEVQSMVPEINLERETGIRAQASFCLQTIGADFPEGAKSVFSPIALYSTTGNSNVVDSDSTVRKRLKDAKTMDVTLATINSNASSFHYIYKGVGTSDHYL